MIKPGIILLLFAMIAVVDVRGTFRQFNGWLRVVLHLSFFDNTALVGPGFGCVEGLGVEGCAGRPMPTTMNR